MTALYSWIVTETAMAVVVVAAATDGSPCLLYPMWTKQMAPFIFIHILKTFIAFVRRGKSIENALNKQNRQLHSQYFDSAAKWCIVKIAYFNTFVGMRFTFENFYRACEKCAKCVNNNNRSLGRFYFLISNGVGNQRQRQNFWASEF